MFHVEQAWAVKISEHEFAALGSSALLMFHVEHQAGICKHGDVPRGTIESTAKERNKQQCFVVPRGTTTELHLAIPNQEEPLQGPGN